MRRENFQLENGSDNSLPMQLHENIHQLQNLVNKLNARIFQLDESIVEKSCVEAYVVVVEKSCVYNQVLITILTIY